MEGILTASPKRHETAKDPPEAWAASYQGSREENQDDYGRADHKTRGYSFRQRGCLYVLADGMGGLESGWEAANLTVREMIGYYRRSPRPTDIREAIVKAVRQANRRVYEVARKRGETMGSTVVACVLKDGKAIVAHAGDSRAYRLAGGELLRCTRDHLYATEVLGIDDDDLAKQGAEGNKITRAVGKEPEIKVDTTEVEYFPEDRFLLCSDGLSEVLDGDEIRECMLKKTPQKAVRALAARASDRIRDNATAIVIFASGKKVRRRRLLGRVALSVAAACVLATVLAGGWLAWERGAGKRLVAFWQNTLGSKTERGKSGSETLGQKPEAPRPPTQETGKTNMEESKPPVQSPQTHALPKGGLVKARAERRAGGAPPHSAAGAKTAPEPATIPTAGSQVPSAIAEGGGPSAAKPPASETPAAKPGAPAPPAPGAPAAPTGGSAGKAASASEPSSTVPTPVTTTPQTSPLPKPPSVPSSMVQAPAATPGSPTGEQNRTAKVANTKEGVKTITLKVVNRTRHEVEFFRESGSSTRLLLLPGETASFRYEKRPDEATHFFWRYTKDKNQDSKYQVSPSKKGVGWVDRLVRRKVEASVADTTEMVEINDEGDKLWKALLR